MPADIAVDDRARPTETRITRESLYKEVWKEGRLRSREKISIQIVVIVMKFAEAVPDGMVYTIAIQSLPYRG